MTGQYSGKFLRGFPGISFLIGFSYFLYNFFIKIRNIPSSVKRCLTASSIFTRLSVEDKK